MRKLLSVNAVEEVSGVFVVCHAPKKIAELSYGDFAVPMVYLEEHRAYLRCCRIMGQHGKIFKEVTPDPHDHVIRQWENEDHTVWLERLMVDRYD